MFDPLARLVQDEQLFQLLRQYVQASEPDREVWHDRPVALDKSPSDGLSRAHGDLLAFGWIEINIDGAQRFVDGKVTACYRVTSAGRQVLGQAADLRNGAVPGQCPNRRSRPGRRGRAVAVLAGDQPGSPVAGEIVPGPLDQHQHPVLEAHQMHQVNE